MDSKIFLPEFHRPPSLDDLQEIAEQLVADLPEEYNRFVKKLTIETEEFPDAKTEDELDLESPYDLLGMYQSSLPATRGSFAAQKPAADILFLYRRPILDVWCETEEDLNTLIHQIIIQEIGYHFGFNEDEIDQIIDDHLHNDEIAL